MKTIIIPPDSIDTACEILLQGGLVAVPTETVYGLAGNGLSADIIDKIYAAKNRPETKAMSLLVPNFDAAVKLVQEITPEFTALAAAFWPGPLTIVLKKSTIVPDLVTSGGTTVGLRCPQHPLTLKILERTGLTLACPSANISGQPSPRCTADVLNTLCGRIDAVVDGGTTELGIESTIADISQSPAKILRCGAIGSHDIFAVLDNISARKAL